MAKKKTVAKKKTGKKGGISATFGNVDRFVADRLKGVGQSYRAGATGMTAGEMLGLSPRRGHSPLRGLAMVARKNPGTLATGIGLGTLALEFGPGLAVDALDAYGLRGREQQILQLQAQFQQAEMARRAMQRQAEQRQAQALMRFARLAPHAFQEVAYGMQLPEGAQVFGGQPDVEALSQLSQMLTQQQPGDPLAQTSGIPGAMGQIGQGSSIPSQGMGF